jgi:hypothetical protein
MPLKKYDLEFIKVYFEEKCWRVTILCREFPGRNWKVPAATVNNSIKRLETTGSIARKPGSGRTRTTRTTGNQDYAVEDIVSQEDPGTHLSFPVIGRYLGISHTSVKRMLLSTKNSEYLVLWHFFGVSIKTLHLLGI